MKDLVKKTKVEKVRKAKKNIKTNSTGVSFNYLQESSKTISKYTAIAKYN